MNDEEINLQGKTLDRIFSQYISSEDQSPVELVRNKDVDLAQSFSRLPFTSVLGKQIEIQRQILHLKTIQREALLLKELMKVQDIFCESEKSFEEVAKCLESLCSSSQDMVYVLTNPTMKDALPLPHHLHRKAVGLVDACAWLIKNKKWHPTEYDVEWDALFEKMQQEIKEWMSAVMVVERCFQDNMFLRENIRRLLD